MFGVSNPLSTFLEDNKLSKYIWTEWINECPAYKGLVEMLEGFDRFVRISEPEVASIKSMSIVGTTTDKKIITKTGSCINVSFMQLLDCDKTQEIQSTIRPDLQDRTHVFVKGLRFESKTELVETLIKANLSWKSVQDLFVHGIHESFAVEIDPAGGNVSYTNGEGTPFRFTPRDQKLMKVNGRDPETTTVYYVGERQPASRTWGWETKIRAYPIYAPYLDKKQIDDTFERNWLTCMSPFIRDHWIALVVNVCSQWVQENVEGGMYMSGTQVSAQLHKCPYYALMFLYDGEKPIQHTLEDIDLSTGKWIRPRVLFAEMPHLCALWGTAMKEYDPFLETLKLQRGASAMARLDPKLVTISAKNHLLAEATKWQQRNEKRLRKEASSAKRAKLAAQQGVRSAASYAASGDDVWLASW